MCGRRFMHNICPPPNPISLRLSDFWRKSCPNRWALLVFWFISPVRSSRWKDGNVRDWSKRGTSQVGCQWLAWVELKVEEEEEEKGHGGKLVRPKRGSPQGVSSLTSASHPCVWESCHKLLTTATLWDLQLVCGSHPLTLTPLILNWLQKFI